MNSHQRRKMRRSVNRPNANWSFLRGLKFPSVPEVGMLWYDTSTGIERRWNGWAWVYTECTTAPDCKITVEVRPC